MRKSLRELALVEYGASPSLVRNQDGNYPIYGTGGVQGFASRSLFDRPITVVGRKGTLGNPIYSPLPCWVIDTAYAVIAKPQIDAKWLYFNLSRFDLESLNEATGVPSINRNYLYRIEFWSPAYPVQQRIARILTTVDNQIEKTEALIAKYQSIKQGLMHDLFTRGVDEHGRLRPSRDEAPQLYKESELGWIPKDWDARQLGEVLKEGGGFLQTGPFGSSLHAHEYVDDGIPVIMPQDINDGLIETTQIARITEKKAQSLFRHRVRPDDVIFSRRGDLSRAAALSERERGWLCGTGCFLLRASAEKLYPEWLAAMYRYHFVQRQVDANAVGSTMPSLNNAVMERLRFPFPKVEEQAEMMRRLNAEDTFARAEASRLAKLQLIKLGLMQDLLTGKVPVKPEHSDQDNGITPNGAPKAGVKSRGEGIHA
jgi:type I restriction enzyme S subunit